MEGDHVVAHEGFRIGDLRELAQPFLPEEPPPRRAGNAGRERERRQSGSPLMLERLEEELEIVVGLALQPLGDRAMQAAHGLVREGGQCSFAYQIVRRAEHAARVHRQASGDELRGCALEPFGRPIREPRRLTRRKRPGGDGEQSEQHRRVCARLTLTLAEKLQRIRLYPVGAGQCLEPERRAGCLDPELVRLVFAQARRNGPGKLDSRVAIEPAQLDDGHGVRAQRVRSRVREGDRGRGRASRRDDDERVARVSRCSEEVVAEGHRQRIDPLQIVKDEKHGLERAERPVRGLEDAKRIQRRSPFVPTCEEQGVQGDAVLPGMGERAKQRGRRSERNGGFGLVARPDA